MSATPLRVLDRVPIALLRRDGGLGTVLGRIRRRNLRIAVSMRVALDSGMSKDDIEGLLLERLAEVIPDASVVKIKAWASRWEKPGSATVAVDAQLRVQVRRKGKRLATQYRALLCARDCERCGRVYWPHQEATVWCLACWRGQMWCLTEC